MHVVNVAGIAGLAQQPGSARSQRNGITTPHIRLLLHQARFLTQLFILLAKSFSVAAGMCLAAMTTSSPASGSTASASSHSSSA
jgi:hypothetical protein